VKRVYSKAGRNFLGRICVQHQSFISKRKVLLVDNLRRLNERGVVVKVIKNSFYTSYVGLIIYKSGLVSYILLAEGLRVGYKIYSGVWNFLENPLKGFAVPLQKINLFANVSNLEQYSFSGFKLMRAAGTSAVLTSKTLKSYLVKLTSGWMVSIKRNSYAVLGQASNRKHKFRHLFKAGRKRVLGVRPTVRGVAKNPCDHPHGGGEGKSSPPRAPVTPWGKLTKGTPTNNKKYHRVKRRLFKNV
jgi:large subunit ribosomal protein L2